MTLNDLKRDYTEFEINFKFGIISWLLGPIAQFWLELPAHNRTVTGSNPVGPTKN